MSATIIDLRKIIARKRAYPERVCNDGIVFESRYGLPEEIQAMRRAVARLPQWFQADVISIWCDSKACACYVVTIKKTANGKSIAYFLADSFKHKQPQGGHNGITVQFEGSDETVCWLDPEWPSLDGDAW